MAKQRANLSVGAAYPGVRNPLVAKYDAAGMGRRAAGWVPPTVGPNRALQGLQTIRNRADDARRNDASAFSITQKWGTTLIGIGIRARFEKVKSKSRRAVLAELFEDFNQECDAEGVWTGAGQQTMAVWTWFSKGECFVRERPRDLRMNLAVPVQFQLLEPEQLPLLDMDTWPGMPQGNKIRSGIEVNKRDQRVAYWFYKEHPGDGSTSGMIVPTADQLVRVPADTVWHIYEPKRPGQLRGVSELAPIMMKLRDLADFEDATLFRQKIANLFVTFITRNFPDEYWGNIEVDPETGLPGWFDKELMASSGMQPGQQRELLPGEDVKFANPPGAGVEHASYMRATSLPIAAASGMPYEIAFGDIQNVSDRALRVIMNEFHRLAEQRQWQVIIPMFCQKFVNAFAKYAAIVGRITLAEVDLVRRCTHAPHGWAYMHPVQDVQGKQAEVEAGFAARSDVISARGDDPELIDEKRAEDRKREDALGLNEPTAAQQAQQASKQQAAAGKKAAKTAKALNEHFGRIEALMSRAPVPAPQAAPTFNISAPAPSLSVNVAPAAPVIENKIDLPAPVIENRIEVPAAEVVVNNNVPAPVVEVTNNVPEATPPVVNVVNNVEPAKVEVTLPDRRTTSTITRDDQGNIKNVVQTETTVK